MKLFFAVLTLFLVVFSGGSSRAQDGKFILLASTIGPIDSGIVRLLSERFEKETGIRVRYVGAGTGAALKIASTGEVDLVMAHAISLEEKFVRGGFGTERIPLMYNDFVLVGPASDPAGIKGVKTAAQALKILSGGLAPFITRGDKSGTHMAEVELWDRAGIKPAGPWYVVYERGAEGNVATLRFTDRKGAYTLMDRASYLALRDQVKLVVLVEGDEAMLNHISLIPVNPKKFSRVNTEGVKIFTNWLSDPEKGQAIIRDFGKDRYGSPLFFPNSREWVKSRGVK